MSCCNELNGVNCTVKLLSKNNLFQSFNTDQITEKNWIIYDLYHVSPQAQTRSKTTENRVTYDSKKSNGKRVAGSFTHAVQLDLIMGQ